MADPTATDMVALAKEKPALKDVIEKAYSSDVINVIESADKNYDSAKELSKLNQYIETGSVEGDDSDD
jgi:hypothetical protein